MNLQPLYVSSRPTRPVGYWSQVPDVFLRTADCLQLVTALQQGFTEIHTRDTHQRSGAGALGLTAIAIE